MPRWQIRQGEVLLFKKVSHKAGQLIVNVRVCCQELCQAILWVQHHSRGFWEVHKPLIRIQKHLILHSIFFAVSLKFLPMIPRLVAQLLSCKPRYTVHKQSCQGTILGTVLYAGNESVQHVVNSKLSLHLVYSTVYFPAPSKISVCGAKYLMWTHL